MNGQKLDSVFDISRVAFKNCHATPMEKGQNVLSKY